MPREGIAGAAAGGKGVGVGGEPGGRGEARFALAVTLAFAAVGLAGLLVHEPWRDELQAWLIASESRTLAELFSNLRYDGHPPLWYLLLYPLTRFTRDPLAMKLLHLAVGASAAYLFARFAPFRRWQRALFCFGYFPLFEYLVVSRNYSLGALCLFAFCAAWRERPAPQPYLLHALLLGLLANTSAYGFMLAWAMALALLVDAWRGRREGPRPKLATVAVAVLLFLALSAVAARVMLPPPDGGNVVGWFYRFNWGWLVHTFSVVWRAYAPVPAYAYCPWNTSALRPDLFTALLACVIIAASLLALARDRAALAAYSSGTLAVLAFTYAKYYGSMRHHGHVYLLFVACLWLATGRRETHDDGPPPHPRLARAGRLLFAALLVLHVFVACHFLALDFVRPFSRAETAARFLRESGLASRYYLVADRDAHTSPLTAYLGRPIFYARGAREGTFIVWDKTWGAWPLIDTMRADLPAAARRKAAERGEDVLAVSTYPLNAPDAEPLGQLTGSIVCDEDYYFYLFRYRK